MSGRGDDNGTRWAARPALARGLRAAVFLSPVAASVGVSLLAHLALGTAGSRAEQAWHLAVLVAVSTVTLVVVDRVGRRALPLVTLLELTMLFPDRAPSRLGVARDALRNRPVEEQLARVREAGADPAVAAREILGLVAALRGHDRPTRGHAERVRMFTDLVAEAMNIPARDRDLLRWAAILHDIGKLRVPPAILNKPGKPTEDEWAVLRSHPSHGAEIAGALLPWLGEWGDVIVQHHERYDGTGYPNGLAGRDISLGGRIVAVADAYDVMTTARPYHRPISRSAAHRELVSWSGRQFDPAVVRAMVGLSAPRLRRAQGALAWLSDIPMVATSYVPAATVARVVGAGALATGAATGMALPGGVVPHGAPDLGGNRTPVSAARASGSGAATGTPVDVIRTAGSTQGDRAHAVDDQGAVPADAATAAATEAALVPTTVTAAGSGQPVPSGSSGDHGSGDDGSSSGGSNSGSGNSGSGNSGSGNSGSGNSGSGSGAVGAVTTTVAGTVDGTGKTVKGTVGAVTSTLDNTVGALTGALGGSGKGSSGNSGSGNSGSGNSGSSNSGPGSASSGSGPVGTAADLVAGTTGAVTGTVNSTVGAVTDTTTGTVTGVVTGLGGLLGGGKKHK
jgi:putative nucleotidyltransferase with HDIG domain